MEKEHGGDNASSGARIMFDVGTRACTPVGWVEAESQA